MKKIWVLMIFLLLVGSVAAISFYAASDFRGNGLYNVSFINMTGNITGTDCIIFNSGGMICTG